MPVVASAPFEGNCYSGDSTVNALAVDTNDMYMNVAVADVRPGYRVLAATSGYHSTPAFAAVKEVRVSPATAPYLTITVVANEKSKNEGNEVDTKKKKTEKKKESSRVDTLRATEHHTFPTCSGATVPALRLKVGDCLHTVHGQAAIATIERTSLV